MRRRELRAAPIATALSGTAALYGVREGGATTLVPNSGAIEEVRELRAALERELEKKRTARSLIDQLQRLLALKDARITQLEVESLQQAQVISSHSTAMEGHSFNNEVASLRARASAAESENAQLRGIAGLLQGQRDAFESVARQLQGHAVAVEGAFGKLQSEAQTLWTHAQSLDDALRRTKRSQTAYEAGLAQLLMLLGKQQAKIRKCVGGVWGLEVWGGGVRVRVCAGCCGVARCRATSLFSCHLPGTCTRRTIS